ncbi:MAG: thioredoxin domain-containing protein, partial [Deltaproteobacteria bacterium]|nr:thioredoxin domain-containing protein [Deltaproteobacteria bacterium]
MSRDVLGRGLVAKEMARASCLIAFAGLVGVVALLSGCATTGGAGGGSAVVSLSAQDDAMAVVLLTKAGIKASDITPAQRQRILGLAQQTRCPCPEIRGSLAECAAQAGCVRAPFVVRAIVRGVAPHNPKRHISDVDLMAQLLERFGPREPESIDLILAACRGPKTAPVTLVVFSDFQCPFCAIAGPLVERLEALEKGKVRTCFLNLVVHRTARLAAMAVIAAQLQGKFWPYHDILFTHQRAQERSDLIVYARKLGLDVDRFKADLDGDIVKMRLLRQKIIAQKLRLRGTPSFFVNGRPMTDPKRQTIFQDWIEEALAIEAAKGKG